MEGQGFGEHVLVEAEFVVVTRSEGLTGVRGAVGECGAVGPVGVDEVEMGHAAAGDGEGIRAGWGRGKGNGKGGDEDTAFEVPVYGACAGAQGWDTQALWQVIPDQGCDAVDFAAEAGGVVFVAGEGVVDCVRRVWRGRGCVVAGDG